jgi:alcohol oxidase
MDVRAEDRLVLTRAGSFLAKLIDPKTGRRANAAHSYLYDRGHASTGSNIRILTHKTVLRVTFDGTRASGLEVCDTPRSPLDEAVSGIQQVKARKLVLVCGGAFGTPTILERSGIGKSDFLEGLGIDVVVDLPGVGKEYQDHEVSAHEEES